MINYRTGIQSAEEGGKMGANEQQRSRGNPIVSLAVAILFAALASVGVVVAVMDRLTPSASVVLVGVPGLVAFAFFTRWLQRVDRSRSQVLQFLERVRCYIAHEDVSPAKPAR
jgi:Flp pilus assembly protein TadB